MQAAHGHFNLAAGEVGVHRIGRPLHHLAHHRHHRFRLQLGKRVEQPAAAIGHALGHAVMVAQVEEGELPMVAHPVHPAGKLDLGAGVSRAQLIAGMGAVGVHGGIPLVYGGHDIAKAGQKAKKDHEKFIALKP